jgi:hypothetical protein
MFWVFKLSFVVDILASFFDLATFGLFFEKFGNFFLIVWSLWLQVVEDFVIAVRINESLPIKDLKVPAFKSNPNSVVDTTVQNFVSGRWPNS